jgi:hypothetical protein
LAGIDPACFSKKTVYDNVVKKRKPLTKKEYPMRFIIMSLLTLGFCFAEEPVKPLPKDVQTIVDSREADLQAARIAFDKAVFEANKKAIGKMESVVKTSTQKGDLDGALASKKFVEDWTKEKETAAVTGSLGGAGPKVDDLSKLIVGKWKFQYKNINKNGIITISKDNKVQLSDGNSGTLETIDDSILIKWENGSKWSVIYKNKILIATASDGEMVMSKF